MRKRSKYRHVINWDKISLIVAVLTLVVVVILNYNQREINILLTEKSTLEKENSDLKAVTDPSWQEKFNTQRQYFESEISDRDKKISAIQSNISSMKKDGYKLDTNNVVLPLRVARKVMKRLVQAENDSIILGLYEQQIAAYRKERSLGDGIIDLQSKQIQNLQKIIELYGSPQGEYTSNKTLVRVLALFSFLSCITIFISLYKLQKISKSKRGIQQPTTIGS